jgi:hypothetical protein
MLGHYCFCWCRSYPVLLHEALVIICCMHKNSDLVVYTTQCFVIREVCCKSKLKSVLSYWVSPLSHKQFKFVHLLFYIKSKSLLCVLYINILKLNSCFRFEYTGGKKNNGISVFWCFPGEQGYALEEGLSCSQPGSVVLVHKQHKGLWQQSY